MIIVDTNVVSEAMKPAPSPQVIQWLNQVETVSLFLTTITIAEISFGIWILPDGKKRRTLQQAFDQLVAEAFQNRVLVFDEQAGRLYGEIMAERRRIGKPLGVADGEIVSIARDKGFSIATRDLGDFSDCGVNLIDPFVHQ